MEDPKKLSDIDRKHLVLGSVGYYFFLCHDDSQDDDMTPAEAYEEYSSMTNAELIHDSSVFDIFESCEEYYDTYSSYIPEEYSLKWALSGWDPDVLIQLNSATEA